LAANKRKEFVNFFSDRSAICDEARHARFCALIQKLAFEFRNRSAAQRKAEQL
jgi:hypothetical protein